MSLRPPSTPRASISSSATTAGSTPTSLPFPRRRSLLPQPGVPLLNANESKLDSLKEAMKMNDPRGWNNNNDLDSPASGAGSRRLASSSMKLGLRHTTNSNNTPSRPTTPTFSSLAKSSSATPIPPVPSRLKVELGDRCNVDVTGEDMHGVLRFLGKVEGKDGIWAGVELEGEWKGHGKNDGSVAGVQYFACPPKSGLFLPTSKVTPVVFPSAMSPSSSTSSLHLPLAPSTPSARRLPRLSTFASSSSRSSALSPTPTSPSKPPRPSAVTPSTPTSSHSVDMAISTSTPSQATPRPRPRPYIGPTVTPSASTTTKSVGTPRRSLGPGALSTPKRPGSSLRHHAPMPVPPLPTSNPLLNTGSMLPPPTTPSHTRRTSTASSVSSHLSRSSVSVSDTSDLLPSGRKSVMGSANGAHPPRSTTPLLLRSASRASSHSSVGSFGGVYAEELKDAKERERETRVLLEASERVGREVEERLASKEADERLLKRKVRELEDEIKREKETKEKEIAAAVLTATLPTASSNETESLHHRLAELTTELASLQSQTTKQSLSWQTKHAYQTSEIDSLRERLTSSASALATIEAKFKESELDKEDLTTEVDKLRRAGQQLCESYEERLREVELLRAEAEERLEVVLRGGNPDGEEGGSPFSSPSTRLSLQHSLGSSHTSAAAAIDAESAMAEVEHLRSRMGNLEEALEEAKVEIESLREAERKRRAKMTETENGWRAERDGFRADAERAAKREAKLVLRISELESALAESEVALERERSEIEGLRHDTVAAPAPGAAVNTVLVNQLRDDLKQAEKELEKLHVAGEGAQVKKLKVEIVRMEERNKELMVEAQTLRDAQHGLEVTVSNLMTEMTTASSSTLSGSTSSTGSRLEVDELRAKLQEADARAERERKHYAQEIAELESLVESKIYKEDDLEAELEKYKKLAALNGPRSHTNGSGRSGHSPSGSGNTHGDDEGLLCEMCGDAGHDLDNCPIFGTPKSKAPSGVGSKSGDYCDDCEEYGHTLEACTMSNEIF